MGRNREEAADIDGVEVAGVALIVEQDEKAYPVGVAFARPRLAEALQGNLADEVEQPRWLR